MVPFPSSCRVVPHVRWDGGYSARRKSFPASGILYYLVSTWSWHSTWTWHQMCKTVLRPPLFSFDVETSILESLSLRSFQRGATLLPSRRHSEAVAAGLSILSRNGCVHRPHRRPTEPTSHYPRVGCPMHLLTPYLSRCAPGGAHSVTTTSKGKTALLNPRHPGPPYSPILPSTTYIGSYLRAGV